MAIPLIPIIARAGATALGSGGGATAAMSARGASAAASNAGANVAARSQSILGKYGVEASQHHIIGKGGHHVIGKGGTGHRELLESSMEAMRQKPSGSNAVDEAKQAMDRMQAIKDKLIDAADKAMKSANMIMRDDYVQLFGQLLPESARKFLNQLNELTNAIVERGRYLSKYNGELALATAQADVRKMQSERFEARVAGGSYSRVIDEQSKLENGLRDTFAPIKEGIASIVGDLLELTNNIRELLPLKQAAFAVGEILGLVGKITTFDVNGIVDRLDSLPKRLRQIFGDAPDGVQKLIDKAIAEAKASIPNERRPNPFANPPARAGFPAVNGL
jgi:hypothetical protein